MLNISFGGRQFILIHPCCSHRRVERRKRQRSRCKYYRSQIAHYLCILTASGTEHSPKHLTLSRQAKKWVYPYLTEGKVWPRDKRWLSQGYTTAGDRSGSLRDTSTTQVWEELTSFSGSGWDYVERKSRLVINASDQVFLSSPLFQYTLTIFSKFRGNNYKSWCQTVQPDLSQGQRQSSERHIWESCRVQQGKPLQGSSCCFTTRDIFSL